MGGRASTRVAETAVDFGSRASTRVTEPALGWQSQHSGDRDSTRFEWQSQHSGDRASTRVAEPAFDFGGRVNTQFGWQCQHSVAVTALNPIHSMFVTLWPTKLYLSWKCFYQMWLVRLFGKQKCVNYITSLLETGDSCPTVLLPMLGVYRIGFTWSTIEGR